MKGSSHFALGAVVGIGVGIYSQADPLSIGLYAGIGAITGLLPDLDTNGLASNKITLSKNLLKTPMLLLGISLILYSLYLAMNTANYDTSFFLSMGIGVVMLLFSTFITQKRMLAITGVGIIFAGIALHITIWIILLGIYVIVASFLSHRSYTHSLIGLCYFAVMLHMAEASLEIHGLFIVGILGYISHLVTDMKLLPMNRRGVKFFAPVWKKEF